MPRTQEQNELIREQSKSAIVKAAFELFAQVGFDSTSMAAIAKQAKVSKGLIYHHFESKEDVLRAVFNQLAEVGNEVMSSLEIPETPQAKLSHMIDMAVVFTKENPGWIRLLVHMALQEDVVAGLSDQIDALRKGKVFQMVPIFEELGYDDPEAAAYYFGAQMDGITIGYLSLGEEYPLDLMIEQLKAQYKIK